jgi:Tfp pilus assembly protein PilF
MPLPGSARRTSSARIIALSATVWLARVAMAEGKLDDARVGADKARASAGSGAERASAQFYRGLVFGRQGDLAQAEVAFKAAAAANPRCLECRFNLGHLLLKQAKDAEGVEVLKTIAAEFSGTPENGKFNDSPLIPAAFARTMLLNSRQS